MSFISQNGFAKINDDVITLQIDVSDDLREYCEDLIDYGLTRYNADYSDSTDFKLWQNYRMDQVQLKLLKNPGYTQLGTYVYDKDIIIFASLKKDLSGTDRLNYKDKFLQANLFQWECEVNISDKKLAQLNESERAYVFIRKVSDEMPFIYVGTGKLTNPRKQTSTDAATGKSVTTYLYDIPMDQELPDYLQYDFGLLSK